MWSSLFLALNPQALLKGALFSFMQGRGLWLRDSYYVGTDDEAGRQSFRDTLVDKIHRLTGKKPGTVQQKNDEGKLQWAIKPAE